jgi:hypothetical protein
LPEFLSGSVSNRSQQCCRSAARVGCVLEAVPAAGGDDDYSAVPLDEESLVRGGRVEAGLDLNPGLADGVAEALPHPLRRVPGGLRIRLEPDIGLDHGAWSVECGLEPSPRAGEGAVVGSSAITSVGRRASAMAIMTRWRRPPDSSCGNCSNRRAGSGTLTSARSSRASAREAHISMSWAPIRLVGFREVIGSWKTAPACERLASLLRSGDAATMSVPARLAHPLTAASAGSKPSAASPRTLLPDPDSPTRPYYLTGRDGQIHRAQGFHASGKAHRQAAGLERWPSRRRLVTR